MSLREQFEAWWKSQRAAYGMNIAWQAYQAGHAVNADLIQALHECIGWFEDNQVDCIALDEAREAIKKARGE